MSFIEDFDLLHVLELEVADRFCMDADFAAEVVDTGVVDIEVADIEVVGIEVVDSFDNFDFLVDHFLCFVYSKVVALD